MIDLRIQLDERRRGERLIEIDQRGRAAFLDGAKERSRRVAGWPLRSAGLARLTSEFDVLELIVAGASTVTTGAMHVSQVSDTLIAWREAQRRLKAAEDPDEIPALTAEAARLHEAYRKAIAVEAEAIDVKAHGEPSDAGGEPEP